MLIMKKNKKNFSSILLHKSSIYFFISYLLNTELTRWILWAILMVYITILPTYK